MLFNNSCTYVHELLCNIKETDHGKMYEKLDLILNYLYIGVLEVKKIGMQSLTQAIQYASREVPNRRGSTIEKKDENIFKWILRFHQTAAFHSKRGHPTHFQSPHKYLFPRWYLSPKKYRTRHPADLSHRGPQKTQKEGRDRNESRKKRTNIINKNEPTPHT